MSLASERLKRESQKIQGEIIDALEDKPAASWPWSIIVLLIFCTMFPVDTISSFFSVVAIVTITGCLAAAYRHILSIDNKPSKVIDIITFDSIILGCTPVLFSQDIPVFSGMVNEGTKVYTLQRINVLGFGLSDADSRINQTGRSA